MPRLPFDPDKMAQKKSVEKASSKAVGKAQPISVSRLAALIGSALRDALPGRLRVTGEVSGFRDRTHWYFDIKDADAVVGCVMFASAARRATFTPESGQQVIVSGRVEFYAKQGRTSLIVDRIEPAGAGALEQAYRALCAELKALGWFDVSRKRPLPAFPRRVAVVTSRTGAALQDVIDTARRRCPGVGLVVVDVRVQGDGAAPEVASAIDRLSAASDRLGIDAIIVTRGGGSMEDLWAFNERDVARAIVACRVPVVAAIGHETDTTIAELVADERAATPTQAAMRVTPDATALLEQVDSLADRLASAARRMVRFERQRLAAPARHALFTDPAELVRMGRQQLAEAGRHLRSSTDLRLRESIGRLERVAGRLERHRPVAVHARRAAGVARATDRLHSAMDRLLTRWEPGPARDRLGRAVRLAHERNKARLDAIERELAAVGPIAVLRRGYSCTIGEDGTLVRVPGDVRPGQIVRTRLADGSFRSKVVGDGPDPLEKPHTKPRRPAPEPPQMDLFSGDG